MFLFTSLYVINSSKKRILTSVVAKKLGWRLKIKLRWLKQGVKRLMLSAEGPVVLY